MQFSKCCERNWRIKIISDNIVICIVCEEILLYKSFILFKNIKAEEIDLWILRIETMIWFYIIWWPQQHWKLYTLGQNLTEEEVMFILKCRFIFVEKSGFFLSYFFHIFFFYICTCTINFCWHPLHMSRVYLTEIAQVKCLKDPDMIPIV